MYGGEGGGHGYIAIPVRPVAIENHPADSRVKLDESGTVQTLTTRMGTGGGNVPMLAVPDKAYSIQGSMIGRADKNGPQGDGINEDVSFTLNTTDRHAVAYGVVSKGNGEAWITPERHMALNTGGGQAGQGYPAVLTQEPKVYGICSDGSNSMKSGNPHSGIYEADTSRTIDQNGGNPACNQGGMAIVQCIEPGALSRGQGERAWDKCPTLRAKMGDNHPCVVLNDQGGSQMSVSNDVVGTLRVEMHGNIPAVTTYQKTTGPLMANSHPGSYTGQDTYSDSDMLVTPYAHSSFADYKEGFGQLRASGGDLGGGSETLVKSGYSVRRLTPLECERLQGFPDGWTDIPGQTEATQEELEFWREVWLTWDKTQTEDPDKVKPRTDKAILKWLKNPTSDSAQYKALGNSVAVPCPEYVLEGIKEVLEVASVSDIESYSGD